MKKMRIPALLLCGALAVSGFLGCGKNIDKTSRYFLIMEASDRSELEERIELVHKLLQVNVDNGFKTKGIVWN